MLEAMLDSATPPIPPRVQHCEGWGASSGRFVESPDYFKSLWRNVGVSESVPPGSTAEAATKVATPPSNDPALSCPIYDYVPLSSLPIASTVALHPPSVISSYSSSTAERQVKPSSRPTSAESFSRQLSASALVGDIATPSPFATFLCNVFADDRSHTLASHIHEPQPVPAFYSSPYSRGSNHESCGFVEQQPSSQHSCDAITSADARRVATEDPYLSSKNWGLGDFSCPNAELATSMSVTNLGGLTESLMAQAAFREMSTVSQGATERLRGSQFEIRNETNFGRPFVETDTANSVSSTAVSARLPAGFPAKEEGRRETSGEHKSELPPNTNAEAQTPSAFLSKWRDLLRKDSALGGANVTNSGASAAEDAYTQRMADLVQHNQMFLAESSWADAPTTSPSRPGVFGGLDFRELVSGCSDNDVSVSQSCESAAPALGSLLEPEEGFDAYGSHCWTSDYNHILCVVSILVALAEGASVLTTEEDLRQPVSGILEEALVTVFGRQINVVTPRGGRVSVLGALEQIFRLLPELALRDSQRILLLFPGATKHTVAELFMACEKAVAMSPPSQGHHSAAFELWFSIIRAAQRYRKFLSMRNLEDLKRIHKLDTLVAKYDVTPEVAQTVALSIVAALDDTLGQDAVSMEPYFSADVMREQTSNASCAAGEGEGDANPATADSAQRASESRLLDHRHNSKVKSSLPRVMTHRQIEAAFRDGGNSHLEPRTRPSGGTSLQVTSAIQPQRFTRSQSQRVCNGNSDSDAALPCPAQATDTSTNTTAVGDSPVSTGLRSVASREKSCVRQSGKRFEVCSALCEAPIASVCVKNTGASEALEASASPRLALKLGRGNRRVKQNQNGGPTFWGMWEDERNRMVYVSWLPRVARACERKDKRRCELMLKDFISRQLGFEGVEKVLLFPPTSAHCKLLFDGKDTAQKFMDVFGSRGSAEGPDGWKRRVCSRYGVEIRDGIASTSVKIIWADGTRNDSSASTQSQSATDLSAG